MNPKQHILRFLRRRGYELTRFPIKQFMNQYRFDVVIDVGANVGQFACELRDEVGYSGRIVSFEPLSSAFAILNRKVERDPEWHAINVALGSEAGRSTIHVTGNSASSSLLEMLPKHVEAAPHAAVVSTESVEVRRMDDLFGEIVHDDERALLKIDAQGFELEVLKGASRSLERISGILIELNLGALYAGAPLAEEVMAQLRQSGFEPFWFVPGFRDPRTQQLLQMDGYFVRSGISPDGHT